MFSNEKAGKTQGVLLPAILFVLSLSTHSAAQSLKSPATQEIVESAGEVLRSTGVARRNLENYKGQNGILSMKTLVLGGEFRVTTVVPFSGNVADYTQLEITKPISLVGRALSLEASERQVAKIKSQFESKKIFDSVTVIDSYSPALYDRQQKQLQITTDDVHRGEDDPLAAPIGNVEEMEARDRQRKLKEQDREQVSPRTLVTVIEVLDYAKGSRLKQALPLDLGKSILTVRLRYYDKTTGQEIGRQIISGQSDGSSLLGPLSPRDALSGVADGLVDQVTRRVAASVK
jgi:hypothetical protein